MGALGQLRHRPVELALVDRLRRLEAEMIARGGSSDRWEMADRLCSALARHATTRAIRAVAAHAYNRAPALGDALARFELLSRVDLTVDPEQLAVLLKAIRDLTPSNVLGLRRQTLAPRAVLSDASGVRHAGARGARRADDRCGEARGTSRG